MNIKSLLVLTSVMLPAVVAGHGIHPLPSDRGSLTEAKNLSPAKNEQLRRRPGKLSVDMGEYASDTIRLITERPAGNLRIYNRTGWKIEGIDGEDDNMEFVKYEQSSTLSVVFGDNGDVWIKNPVSGELRETWVPGKLSADGKQIVIPMFKFIDYLPSLDFGRQLCVCTWSEADQMYLPDMSVTEVRYAVEGDRITLLDTDRNHILSAAFRAKGETEEEYHYDGTWAERGDYGSIYGLYPTQPLTLPSDIETQIWSLSGTQRSLSWKFVKNEATLAFDGDTVYMTGISDTYPDWCIKGYVTADELRFPSGQFVGTDHDNPYYFGGTDTDVTFSLTEEGLYHCNEMVYLGSTPDAGQCYYWYYDGMRLTDRPLPDLTVMPEGKDRLYEMQYKAYIQSIDFYYDSKDNVKVAIVGDDVYIGGIWYAPDGVIKGRIENGKAIFDANQFLGAGGGSQETWFIPFDNETRQPVDALILDYNPADRSLTNPSASISISTIDHRNVGLFWYFSPSFTLLENNPARPCAPRDVTIKTSPYTNDLYIDFFIPTVGVDDVELIENYLGYSLFVDTPSGIQPYRLTSAHVASIEDPIELIPYNLIGMEVTWTMGYHNIRLIDLPANVTGVGVQTVYTGGDEENRSETVWASTLNVGLENIGTDSRSDKIYDLHGRSVTGTLMPGVYIINGKKVMLNSTTR